MATIAFAHLAPQRSPCRSPLPPLSPPRYRKTAPLPAMTSTANNQPPDKPNRRSLPASARPEALVGRAAAAPVLAAARRGAACCAPASSPLAARHRLKQRKAERVAVLLPNAMIERAHSTAERRTINHNGGQNDAPQIRRATEKIKPHAERSKPRHNRHQTIKNQIRKTN